MWGFFQGKPACPIPPEMRDWVDDRFCWLQEQFGVDAPCNVRVILPIPEFFPDPYDGKLDDVRAILARVAGYMGVDPATFELFLYDDTRGAPMIGSGSQWTSSPAGLYFQKPDDAQRQARATIGIEARRLGDPMSLVATLAHEIGHEILLGQKRISTDEPDHEPLTDLLSVFMGMGIFAANSTIRDRGWSRGQWSGWHTSRLGYLDQRTFGYALAQFARVRGETKPAWMKHVRPDVRAPMKQSLRFLAAES